MHGIELIMCAIWTNLGQPSRIAGRRHFYAYRTPHAMVTRAPDNADRHAQTDMPDEAEHALRFSRAREAQSNALIEDYVELIADLLQSTREARTTDIARRFGVSHPTAIKNIARLKSAGLVESRPYRGCF